MVRRKFVSIELVLLAEAVWLGRIDGWNTREVSVEFGISQASALRSLKAIVKGEIFDEEHYPFGEYNEDMGGVEIQRCATFTYGDDGDYSEGRKGAANHYNWFSH